MEAEEFALTNLLLVALLAFAVPFVPAFFPRVRVASPVLELVAGILFGPALLGWIEIDAPVEIMSRGSGGSAPRAGEGATAARTPPWGGTSRAATRGFRGGGSHCGEDAAEPHGALDR